MTKYQLITTILALIIMAFLGSCNSEPDFDNGSPKMTLLWQ
ncbi:MAG: hypothetical protein PARBA_01283 [Parabacteroides sp.]